jgi:glyoxylase-like metal-dependent hydrolase (beta-lactamase superfamily II)
VPHTIDLRFQGRPGVIATAAIAGDDGLLLVDPGPTSCLPALVEGLAAHGHSLADVRAVLLTHIHLDHAGVTGTLAERLPNLAVYVHEVGARHLAAPEKLLASAMRLYGDDMPRLWGDFKAVPAAALRALKGGEVLRVGGRTLHVAYTPGHAVHHVSYFDEADRVAYVGDTAGIVVGDFVLAATPPPDIDLERWDASLSIIEGWAPATLYLTHFGAVPNLTAHIARYRSTLARSASRVREALETGGDEATLVQAWVEWLRAEARAVVSDDVAAAAESAAPFDQVWQGLARYWRKRAERDGLALGTPPR